MSDVKPSIAFQGERGAFSHSAALTFARRLGIADAPVVSCQTFGAVFAGVVEGRTTYGAVPLENSSIGSIVANYDLLWEHDAVIVAEYLLPVHHQLIGFPDANIDEIKQVFSHPAALDQCRQLFRRHAGMAPRVHWDTSASVIHVRESGDRRNAAIASALAAKEHNMTILAEDIEDFPANTTRFGLIAAANSEAAGLIEPAGSQFKESFAVELKHEVGSLSRLLAALTGAGANLTKIESRPIGATPWHYRFFMDVEVAGPRMEADLEKALGASCIRFKPLGRYASATNPASVEG